MLAARAEIPGLLRDVRVGAVLEPRPWLDPSQNKVGPREAENEIRFMKSLRGCRVERAW
jgi:hypothetical protein